VLVIQTHATLVERDIASATTVEARPSLMVGSLFGDDDA
jgi:hypothetical protein